MTIASFFASIAAFIVQMGFWFGLGRREAVVAGGGGTAFEGEVGIAGCAGVAQPAPRSRRRGTGGRGRFASVGHERRCGQRE